MQLNAKAFALSAGILWGLGLMVLTLITLATGYADNLLLTLTELYPGYTISLGGAFIGLVYGFVDAFIGCYIFAWLYNLIAKK